MDNLENIKSMYSEIKQHLKAINDNLQISEKLLKAEASVIYPGTLITRVNNTSDVFIVKSVVSVTWNTSMNTYILTLKGDRVYVHNIVYPTEYAVSYDCDIPFMINEKCALKKDRIDNSDIDKYKRIISEYIPMITCASGECLSINDVVLYEDEKGRIIKGNVYDFNKETKMFGIFINDRKDKVYKKGSELTTLISLQK